MATMKFLLLISVVFVPSPGICNYQNYEDYDDGLCPPLTNPNIKYFRRVISYGTVQPDNYIQRGILTNGRFPADPITVNKGDTVIIECENRLDRNFTLHFHTLHQKGTVRSDGVPYATQRPIFPNGTYYYIINIHEQMGTFLYHSHTELHLIFVFAPFIILEKEYTPTENLLKHYRGYHYYEERTLILSQLWHTSIQSMYAGLSAQPFQPIPKTDSLLVNGKSFGTWETNNGNASGFYVVHVEQYKCYRFRIISGASNSALQFFIMGHKGKIIEVDGIITNPVETDHLNLNVAQRYSCIYCMNQPVGNYLIRVKETPGPGPLNGIAILHYKGAPNPEPLRKQIPKYVEDEPKEVPLEPLWLKGLLIPSSYYPQHEIVYAVPKYVDKTIIVRSIEKTNATGYKYFELNGQFVPKRRNDIMIDLIQKDFVDFRKNTSLSIYILFELVVRSRVQMVFVNHVGSDGNCEQHPWHLHGHSFHIVGDGADDFRPEIEGIAIQKKFEHLYAHSYFGTPFSFRDVLTLFPNQTQINAKPGDPCGWIAIRFVANNPGVWMGHCLLTAHLIMGERFVLYEHTPNDPFLQEQCYFNGQEQKPY